MSIGEELAEARHQADLTVAQVSQRTRIRQTIIRGIEGDDYSVCGGDFYARGHIRSIAKTVGADPEQLILEYDAAHKAPTPVSATSIDELITLGRRPPRRRTHDPQTPRPRRRRPRWAVLLGVALAAALALIAIRIVTLASGRPQAASGVARVVTHHHASAAPTAAASTAPPTAPAPRPAVTAQTLVPVSATAFGTSGTGQGDNPQDAQLAIDRDAATAWSTDWYTTAQFGNLYPGTGLLLDMGRPVTITTARIILGSAPGAGLQLRVGSAPALADLPPVAHAANAGGVVSVRLATPARGRYVLIWFTSLPPDPAGTFQASVYDVRLKGRA
jgi:cytoskeletal protein RodZ